MDWQTPAALAVVAATAAAFLWNRFRPRKATFAKATGCGCAGAAGSRPPGLVIRSRRGERPTIELRES